ncbi:MAG: hypothetical protein LBT51_03110 [Fusobacteriaceae bacterium]|jgi:hypothetical protein|nr:hypothetical protein [Fusobacteriaceae bacterium]
MVKKFNDSYYPSTIPSTNFDLTFLIYKYLNVDISYDGGRFQCYLNNGNGRFPLENKGKWYLVIEIDKFLPELEKQVKLRIPDKYLKYFKDKIENLRVTTKFYKPTLMFKIEFTAYNYLYINVEYCSEVVASSISCYNDSCCPSYDNRG